MSGNLNPWQLPENATFGALRANCHNKGGETEINCSFPKESKMDILGQVGMLPPDQILESEDDEEQAASVDEEVRVTEHPTERIVGGKKTLGLNNVSCLIYQLKSQT